MPGDTEARRRRRIAAAKTVGSPAQRLFNRVQWQGDCLIWPGSKDSAGYGRIGAGSRIDGTRRLEGVHRVAWAAYFGPIPPDKQVLHRCDTPACVRREHLFLGTHADNMDDKVKKGRGLYKLTIAQRDRIKNGTEGIHALARELGVSPSTVHRHRHRRKS